MSDAPEDQIPEGKFVSQVDSLFAAAFNEVYNPEDPATPPAGGEPAAPAGEGDQAPAAPVEGAPGAGEPAAAPAAGVVPDPAAAPDGEGSPDGDAAPAGTDPGAPAAPAAGTPTAAPTHAEVIPKFAEASKAISDNAAASFRNQAIRELAETLRPEYAQALGKHPYMLVNTEVPNLRGDGNITIRDSAEAKEWQEAANQLMEAEISSRVSAKADESKPMMNILQESVLLFQNNADLVPGTAEFDQDLAERFAEHAKSFEHRINGKLYGYQVPVQNLVNTLRSKLVAERAAAGTQSPAATASAARQAQAAQQQRDAAGQFEAPQAGIPAKAGSGGADGENYDPFWNAAFGGAPTMNV